MRFKSEIGVFPAKVFKAGAKIPGKKKKDHPAIEAEMKERQAEYHGNRY